MTRSKIDLQQKLQAMSLFEKRLRKQGYGLVAGVDEAGRGPLAGPVVAGACILPQGFRVQGIDDSKKLSSLQREILYKKITSHPKVIYGVGIVEPEEIDQINILQATFKAMRKAVESLLQRPDFLLFDGKQYPDFGIDGYGLAKGDMLCLSVAAASIIAKYRRDSLMDIYHEKWPEYRFDRHRGYGTKLHRDTLAKYGPCPIHRNSFSPVQAILDHSASTASYGK